MCIVQLSGSNFNSTVSPPSLARINEGWIHCDFGCAEGDSNINVHSAFIK